MENRQQKQGKVTARGEGPKVEEHTATKEKRLQGAVVCVFKELFPYAARFRHEVLTAALEEVSKTIKPADELLAMEKQVRKICDGLDVKTKAVIAVLGELAVIEGYTIGVEYGGDILYGELRGKALVDEARKQLQDDPDLTCLAKVYELAESIIEAEDERRVRHFGQENIAAPEIITEEPQPKPEEDTETQVQPEQEQPADEITTGIKKLDYYLDQMTHEGQVAGFVLLDIGLRDNEIARKIKDFLWEQVRIFDEEPGSSVEVCQKEGVPENAAEIEWWLALWRGKVKLERATS